MNQGGTVQMLRRLRVVAVAIPLLLFGAAAWKDRVAILDAAEDDGTKMVALVHEQAENLFTGHEIIVNMIVSRMRDRSWDLVADPADLLHELEDIDRRLDGTSEILVVDATGTLRATTVPMLPGEPPPAVDPECFRLLATQQTERCISKPHTDAGSQRNVFSLSRRLERNGAFNGIAQVAISADYIAQLWASTTPSATDVVTLFTSDGTILVQSRPEPQSEPDLGDLGKVLLWRIAQSESGILTGPVTAGGRDRITIYKRLAENQAVASLSLDKQAVLFTWYANLTVYGLVAAIATAGILLALRIALRRAEQEREAVELWRTESEEREKAQDQLRQSQKMESLGKLTGGIAHDFNNLLTVIIGNIAMIPPAPLDAQNRRFRQNALRAGESAASLTQRLLAFARKQVLRPQPLDLMSVVESMRPLLLRTVGPDIRLNLSSDRHLWPALIDLNQLELVILNLAINARDAMPSGGTLSIAVVNGEVPSISPNGAQPPASLMPGQYVVLTVCDTGIGMDAATLVRATEPFFTTKGVGKGTGLGLSMMQGFVLQSGGATRLQSSPGEGTSIEMWLPRAYVAPEELPSYGRQHEEQGGGTLLVCDDDPGVLELVCDALERSGYQAVPVRSGQAALEVLQRDEAISLLIVDFTMPEMNGGLVVRAALADRPHLPILLITGNADTDSIRAELPGVTILCKPFTPDQLADSVAELLGSGQRRGDATENGRQGEGGVTA